MRIFRRAFWPLQKKKCTNEHSAFDAVYRRCGHGAMLLDEKEAYMAFLARDTESKNVLPNESIANGCNGVHWKAAAASLGAAGVRGGLLCTGQK